MDPSLKSIIENNTPPQESQIRDLQLQLASARNQLSILSLQEPASKPLDLNKLVTSLQGALSLIRRIPSEILGEIFTICRDDALESPTYSITDEGGPPTVFTLVSSRWRALCLADPRLWNRFHIASVSPMPPSARVDCMMERSGSLPRYIQLRISLDRATSHHTWHTSFPEQFISALMGTRPSRTFEMISIVVEPLHLPRPEPVEEREVKKVGAGNAHEDRAGEGEEAGAGDADERAGEDGQDEDEPVDEQVLFRQRIFRELYGQRIFQQCPLYAHARLDATELEKAVTHSLFREFFRTVRSLQTMYDAAGHTTPVALWDDSPVESPWQQRRNYVQAGMKLEECASIQQCSIVSFFHNLEDTQDAHHPSSLEDLRHLGIEIEGLGNPAHLIDRFSFPRLTSLTISGRSFSPLILPNLYHRSHFKLEELTLHYVDLDGNELTTFLRLLPSLRKIDLELYVLDDDIFKAFTYAPPSSPFLMLPRLETLYLGHVVGSVEEDLPQAQGISVLRMAESMSRLMCEYVRVQPVGPLFVLLTIGHEVGPLLVRQTTDLGVHCPQASVGEYFVSQEAISCSSSAIRWEHVLDSSATVSGTLGVACRQVARFLVQRRQLDVYTRLSHIRLWSALVTLAAAALCAETATISNIESRPPVEYTPHVLSHIRLRVVHALSADVDEVVRNEA
ncbi:hypothetical protein B0H11DRAFT_2265468 [Mycena galericulata]|nr:hypothetical protein B0H11DRAFT_2265468 [Mycena galericulata]